MADRSSLWRDRTTWSRERAAPLRAFLRTESGSAGVLLAAAVAALVWANVDLAGYESVWHAHFSIRLGDMQVDRDLRTWINSGLMTLFFLVVGLEARREFDLGDLRERRRFVLPCVAGLVGMAVPAVDLPGSQRRALERARLGRRDVDRHRAGARSAGAARSRRPRPGAGVPADRLRRRRPDRSGRHRGGLQRRSRLRSAGHRRRGVRRPAGRRGSTGAAALGLRRARARDVVGVAGQRRRPDRHRSGHRAVGPGVLPAPRATRAGDGAGAGRSASSRPRSSRVPRAPASPRRCRPTNGCRPSSTRGRAT